MKIKFLSLLVISPFCFSQNLICTDIQGKKLKDFIQLENRLGNKIFKTDEEYVSVKPVLEPVIFERKEKEIPNLLVFYNGYRKDSAIAEILYEWDVYNFDKGENVKKPLSFNKAMIKKYQELISEVSKKHGKSLHRGSLDDLNLLNLNEGIHRSDEWKINNHITISAYIDLSERYEQQGMMATTPTHRIRLSVTDERVDEANALSQEKISLYNINFLEFLEKLKISDFAGARMSLAERIRPSATDDALRYWLKTFAWIEKLIFL